MSRAKGVITKGIILAYGTTATPTISSAGVVSGGTKINYVQEIPDMGGDRETIEVTTFEDHAHTYINGLLNYGDSMDFTVLHDATQYQTLHGMGDSYYWALAFPDGDTAPTDSTMASYSTLASWQGECSIKVNSVGTNDAMTDTLSLTPNGAVGITTIA